MNAWALGIFPPAHLAGVIGSTPPGYYTVIKVTY